MIKVIGFDIGGTLMEYKDMPFCWLDYYENALNTAAEKLALPLTGESKKRTLEILRSFNPKVNYREVDYTPEHIFGTACAEWDIKFDLKSVINEFFAAFHLTAYIYPDTLPVLNELKARGCKIAALTDVATGMPDELHKSYIPELLPYFDLYVSSISCGMRKPNPKGLNEIAEHFGAAADEMIYIGDEPKDIKCAERFGCKSVLIDRKGSGAELEQDFTVADLNGLKNII